MDDISARENNPDNFFIRNRQRRGEHQDNQNARPNYGYKIEPENDRDLGADHQRQVQRDHDNNQDFDNRPNHHRDRIANYMANRDHYGRVRPENNGQNQDTAGYVTRQGQRENPMHGPIRHNRSYEPHNGNRVNMVSHQNQNRSRNFPQNNGHSRRHYQNENQRIARGNVGNRQLYGRQNYNARRNLIEMSDDEEVHLEDAGGLNADYNRRQDEGSGRNRFANRHLNDRQQEHDGRVWAQEQRSAHENAGNRCPAGGRPNYHHGEDANDEQSDVDFEDISRDNGRRVRLEDARGVNSAYHYRQDEEHRQHNAGNRSPNIGNRDQSARVRARDYRNAHGNVRNHYLAGGRPNYNHKEGHNDEGSLEDSGDDRPNHGLEGRTEDGRRFGYDEDHENHNQYGAADNFPNNDHREHPANHQNPDPVEGHRPLNDAHILQNQSPPYGRIFYASGVIIELTRSYGKVQLEQGTIIFTLKNFDQKIAESLRDFLVIGLVVGVNYHLHDNEWCPIIIGPAAPTSLPVGSDLRLKPVKHFDLEKEDEILESILNTFLKSDTYPTLPLSRFDRSIFRSWGPFISFGGDNIEKRRVEVQNRTNMLKYIDDSKVGLQHPDVFNAVGTLIGVLESRGGVMQVNKLFRAYMSLVSQTLRKVLGEHNNFETFCEFLDTHKWFFAVILERKFVILRRNYTRFNYGPTVSQRLSLIRHFVRDESKRDKEYEEHEVAEQNRQKKKGLSVRFAARLTSTHEYGALKSDNKNENDSGRRNKKSSDKHPAVRHVVNGENHKLQFGWPDPDVENIEQDDERRQRFLASIGGEERGEELPGPSRRHAPY
ncbi:unnamed protein product [Caenorhabditis brenneri]